MTRSITALDRARRFGASAALVALIGGGLVLSGAPTSASAAADLVVDVEGTALVVYSDPASTGGVVGGPELSVQLIIGDHVVDVTGQVPDGVATGDVVSAVVEIPPSVLDELPPGAAADPGLVVESADELGVPLPLQDAQIVDGGIPVQEGITATPGTITYRYVIPSFPGMTNGFTVGNASSLAGSVSGYYAGQSNGALPSSSIPLPIAYNSGLGCTASYGALWAEAVNRSLGYPNSNSGLLSYLSSDSGIHVILVLPSQCSGLGAPGAGNVGDNLHANGVLQIVNGGLNTTTTVHELGHNMGLGHANVRYCPDQACVDFEYGDFWDPMGTGVIGFDTPTELSIRAQWKLGFVDAADIPLIELTNGGPTQSFTVSLTQVSAAAGIGYRIKDPTTGQIAFIENRINEGPSGVFYRQSGYGLSARSDDGGTDAALLTGTGVRLMVQDADGISSSVFAVRRDPEQQRLEATAESINEVVGNATGSIRVTKLNDTTTNNVRIDLDAAVPLSVFRFWSAQYSSHFYTIDPTEFAYVRDSYADSEWTYEGVAYRAFSTQRPGTVPLYRFWSQTQRGHFYTTEVGEKDFIVATYPTDVWNFEGTAFYVYPDTTAVTPTQRVWRFWSPSARHHFFTASDSEKDFVVATYPPSQWTFEGAAFRVPTN